MKPRTTLASRLRLLLAAVCLTPLLPAQQTPGRVIGLSLAGNGGDNEMSVSSLAGAGVLRVDNWNNVRMNASPKTVSGAGLVHSDGSLVAGSFGATLNLPVSYGTASGLSHDALFYRGFSELQAASGSITLSGIPFANYEIHVYADGGHANRGGSVSLGAETYYLRGQRIAASDGSGYLRASGTTWTPGPQTGEGGVAPANHVVFEGLTGPAQTLSFAALNMGDANLRLNVVGIQIVETIIPATPPSIGISLNETLGRNPMTPADLAGANGNRVANWNNATIDSQGNVTLSGASAVYHDGAAVGGSFSAAFDLRATYAVAANLSDDPQLYAGLGVLTEAEPGGTITLSGIPFANYDIYVYAFGGIATRGGSVSLGSRTFYLRGNAKPSADGSGYIAATSTAYDAGSPSLVSKANYVRFAGLSGAGQTIALQALNMGDAANLRLNIAGIQIVATEPVIAPVPLPDPVAYRATATNYHAANVSSGEQFAWHFNVSADRFLDAYEASAAMGAPDVRWLEQAESYYDWAVAESVSFDPDGYPGTIGADIGENLSDPAVTTVLDSLVGDSLLCAPLVRFAGIIRADPSLETRFGTKADAYIYLATEMIWAKWNHRGTYYADERDYGSYHRHPWVIDRADRTLWVSRPDRIVSENLNKHYHAGQVLLRLHRLTGEPGCLERVLDLFGRAKAMFRLLPAENRVVWNFWMPHGPHDMSGSIPTNWVGVHPERPGYQANETKMFLEVYNHGLVFDQTDMERMVATNRWMMANGYPSADGTSSAGQLWPAFAQFDAEIRAAHDASLADSASADLRIDLAHLRHVVGRRLGYAPAFLANPAQSVIDPVAVQPGAILVMATAIPDRIETINQDSAKLVSRFLQSGALSIDLLDSQGAFLGALAQNVPVSANNYHTLNWNGALPATGQPAWGEYQVRWTLNGESRAWPVFVVEGELREDENGPALQPGNSLAYDFESTPSDGRWTLVDAAVSTTRAASGASSLKINRGGQAVLRFGGNQNLPVRIEFDAWDGGADIASGSFNGPAWGSGDAIGDILAFRLAWRGFLPSNGNARYSWTHTGENQWLNVYATNANRATGWNRWVLDYTNPAAPVFKVNDTVITSVSPARRPDGAVEVVFRGTQLTGAQEAPSDLYIDNLVVTYP